MLSRYGGPTALRYVLNQKYWETDVFFLQICTVTPMQPCSSTPMKPFPSRAGGGGGTPYSGLFGEALPQKGCLFLAEG